jgi:hypothetical protein
MTLSSGLERPRIKGDVDRVLLESSERDDVERSLMGGCEDDEGCCTVLVCPQPVGCGHAPSVAGREPGEAILRHRRDQIVTDRSLVLEKLGGDHRADRVAAEVLRTGVAASITKETGDRVGAAGGERSSEDVERRHAFSIAATTAV